MVKKSMVGSQVEVLLKENGLKNQRRPREIGRDMILTLGNRPARALIKESIWSSSLVKAEGQLPLGKLLLGLVHLNLLNITIDTGVITKVIRLKQNINAPINLSEKMKVIHKVAKKLKPTESTKSTIALTNDRLNKLTPKRRLKLKKMINFKLRQTSVTTSSKLSRNQTMMNIIFVEKALSKVCLKTISLLYYAIM